MRLYLPATLTTLATVLRAGEVAAPPAGVAAFGVTPYLREWYENGDQEELEYVATMHAARASLRLLAADPDAPRRRVVLAADVPDADVRAAPDVDRAAVVVKAPVPVGRLVSAHVDDPGSAAAVSAAVTALPAADSGDADALFEVEGLDDLELQWYPNQEFGILLA